MSDSEDDDIKRAIALSLEDNSPAKPTVIDLISDDEDDDLEAPLHIKEGKSTRTKDDHASVIVDQRHPATIVHKEGEKQKKVFRPSKIEPRLAPDTTSKTQSPSRTAMLGLNRAQMEAERLARVQQKKKREEEGLSGLNGSGRLKDSKKRTASISEAYSGSQTGRQAKARYLTPRQRAEEDNPTSCPELPSALPSGGLRKDAPCTRDSWPLTLRERIPARDTSLSSKAPSQRHAPEVLSFNQQQALHESGVRYPTGVVKRTWVRGCPQEDDMIKIEEIFQKDDLDLAVLSTFQVDPDWVSTKLLDKTKVIWVLGARDEEEVS